MKAKFLYNLTERTLLLKKIAIIDMSEDLGFTANIRDKAASAIKIFHGILFIS